MKEKSRSTEIKIVVDAKDNNIDCVATVNVGSIDLDTTIELLQICIDELTKKKRHSLECHHYKCHKIHI